MALDLDRLEQVRSVNGTTIAQCPACAESGGDKKGEHLVIYPSGKFGCVLHPGVDGKSHRRRIAQLAGQEQREARTSAKPPPQKMPSLDQAGAIFSARLGMLETRRDIYQDADGQDVFAVLRFDGKGGKNYRPFYRYGSGWLVGDPPPPLPLFNLPKVLALPNERVYVTEGEKAAKLIGWLRVVATTSAHGAKSPHKTDWLPLKGRDVVILPDNDVGGVAYAEAVAGILLRLDTQADVRVLKLPDLPEKGDAEQWLLQHSDERTRDEIREKLESLVEATSRFACSTAHGNADTSANDSPPSAGVAEDRLIILPGGEVSITESAEKLFQLIAPTQNLFNRGGAVVELVKKPHLGLEVLRPERARSVFERYGKLHAHRVGANGEQVLKPVVCPEETAKALLNTDAARVHLPTINGLVNCPIIVDGAQGPKVVGHGFDGGTGLLITGGEPPPDVPLREAVRALKSLLEEFDFQSLPDRSRALAMLITPALRFGQHLTGSMPIDMAEADQSQSGKSFRHRLVAAVYNEQPKMITQKVDGVGSVDEAFNHALIGGRPFIQFDNFRGRVDSKHLEAFLTAEGNFAVRVPHSNYIEIDPSRFLVQFSSNGVETTRDLANRGCFIRIRKRADHTFKTFPEGDLLSHIRKNQPLYLGCVFAVVREWLLQNRPQTNERRHDFREWCQILDWIVQNILAEAPLMDGHDLAKERVSNPGLSFLRKLALEVELQGRLGEGFIAGQLYELAQGAAIDVPGLHSRDEKSARLIVGRIMAKVFGKSGQIEIEGFMVRRSEETIWREGGSGPCESKSYVFTRNMSPPPLSPL